MRLSLAPVSLFISPIIDCVRHKIYNKQNRTVYLVEADK